MTKRRIEPASGRGFTLIEMLIVMAVILVLMAMSIIGYNVIERNVANHATRTTLQNLKAMQDELIAEAGPGAGNLEGPVVPPAIYVAGIPIDTTVAAGTWGVRKEPPTGTRTLR